MVISWRPSRRLLAGLLFVSLALNLFLGGLTVGRMLHGDSWPWQSSYSRDFGPYAGRAVQRLVRSLDDPDRQIVIESLRAHRDELARLGEAVRDQRLAVEGLIRSPTADRKSLEDAFAEMRKRGQDMQIAMGSALIEAIEKLPPEARRQLAQ